MARHLTTFATALLLSVPCVEAWEHFSLGSKLSIAGGLLLATGLALVLLVTESDA